MHLFLSSLSSATFWPGSPSPHYPYPRILLTWNFERMQVRFLNRVVSSPRSNHFFARHNLRSVEAQHLPQTLEMVTEPGHSKRPMCPSCSKPARFCLCARLKTPRLQNSVAVTILQHSLEKKHPLNSTRIVCIGLQNVSVISVSDVNYEAEFFIRFVNSNLEMGSQILDEKTSVNNKDCNFSYNAAVTFTIEKYGGFVPSQNQDLSKLFGSKAAIDDIRKGFVVKKLYQELEEFELAVPQGSVLLFPSENSVGMEEIEFEVKNLIVLDGTWAKAKRMYNENPWLKVLPHVRLDVEKLSLYSEVRHQPKAGYLSTIESIVYALKGVGEEDSEGLDHLLDVFESMVGDQRRCKDERLGLKRSHCD